MKYAWIKNHRHEYSIRRMCRVLQVSRSGYYDWLKRKPSRLSLWRQELVRKITYFYNRSRKIYGYRKVHMDIIRETELRCCSETVRRQMRAHNMRSKVKRGFVCTTDSGHECGFAENILDGNFDISAPDRVWVADITYIRTKEGWLYLSTVMDLFGRRIVGWSMSSRRDAELVRNALEMALMQRGKPGGLMHHSDRGIQYCSEMYQDQLSRYGIICSMSRKGNCWDNACMESFYGSLKSEWIGENIYETREKAEKSTFIYIEMFYNRERRHASLDYMTPLEYERQYEENHVT